MCEATNYFLSDHDAVDQGKGQETEIMVEGLGESGIVVEGDRDNLVLKNAVDEDNEYDYGYVDDLGDADWQDDDNDHCTIDGAEPDLGNVIYGLHAHLWSGMWLTFLLMSESTLDANLMLL